MEVPRRRFRCFLPWSPFEVDLRMDLRLMGEHEARGLKRSRPCALGERLGTTSILLAGAPQRRHVAATRRDPHRNEAPAFKLEALGLDSPKYGFTPRGRRRRVVEQVEAGRWQGWVGLRCHGRQRMTGRAKD